MKAFSQTYRRSLDPPLHPTASRIQRGEAAIWQRRFWERLIRDEEDLRQHIEYIHYNPVKHGQAYSPAK